MTWNCNRAMPQTKSRTKSRTHTHAQNPESNKLGVFMQHMSSTSSSPTALCLQETLFGGEHELQRAQQVTKGYEWYRPLEAVCKATGYDRGVALLIANGSALSGECKYQRWYYTVSDYLK